MPPSIINSALNDPASNLDATAQAAGINAPAAPAAATTTPSGIIGKAASDVTTYNGQAVVPASATAAPTAAPAAPDYTAQLTDAYQKSLGRAPDAAGLEFWKNKLASGVSLSDVTGAIANSGEAHPAATPVPTAAPVLPIKPTAGSYTPAQVGTPTAWNVTGNQTVANQLQGLMDPNNPLMQQARTQGLELANERGLMNSSIGESAAMNAEYAAAMPVAQADAATYAKAAGYNADQQNQAAMFNANAANQAALAHLQAQTQTDLGYLDTQTKINLTNLSNDNAVKLSTIEAQYHTVMQADASAQALFSQVTQNIATISASKDMDEAAKQAAVDNQLLMLKNGMQVNGAISNLNLGDLLNFGPAVTPAPAEAPANPGAARAFAAGEPTGIINGVLG